MTPKQWLQIEERVEALWGRSTKWVHASSLAHQVQGVSYDNATQAVNRLMSDAEKYAPSPAQIIGMAGQHDTDSATLQRLAEGDCERNGHLLGAPSPEMVRAMGRADMLCSRCGHQERWTIDQVWETLEYGLMYGPV